MPKKAKTKSDKKYEGLLQLFDDIRFDSSINKFKIDNMKKLMRKYIDDVQIRHLEAIEKDGEYILPRPTNATHIWYNEALKYKEEIIMLKEKIDTNKYKEDYIHYRKHFMRVKSELAEEKELTSKLKLENEMLKKKLNDK